MFDVKAIVIAAITAAALGAGGAWVAQDWRYGAIINKNEAKQKSEEAERMRIQLDKYNKLQVERDGIARELAALDGKYAGKQKALQDENTRLTDCLHTGKCGLRIAPGLCTKPTAAADVPQAASTARVDDARPTGPDSDVRQDYLNLRSALKAAQLQIDGLRDYIRTTQPKPEQ